MISLKIRKIGNSLGVVLPAETISRMHLGDGDLLYLTEAPGGDYRLTPFNPEFEHQMELAEEGMNKYKNALRILAS